MSLAFVLKRHGLNFLKFVMDKGRENLLYDIMKSFMNLRDAKLGIASINVKTAFELDEKGKEEFGFE